MLSHTHALFGLTGLAAANALTGFVQPHPVNHIPTGVTLCAGAAILGALVPDLDAEDSTIRHELGGLGILTRLGLELLGLKHRGVLHSGLATVMVLLVSALAGGWFGYADVGLAFGLGYASHVALADAMTISGVPLWWPSSRRFHLLPRPLRVRTGGPAEKLVCLGGAVILAWLLPDLIPPDFLELLGRRWL